MLENDDITHLWVCSGYRIGIRKKMIKHQRTNQSLTSIPRHAPTLEEQRQIQNLFELWKRKDADNGRKYSMSYLLPSLHQKQVLLIGTPSMGMNLWNVSPL